MIWPTCRRWVLGYFRAASRGQARAEIAAQAEDCSPCGVMATL
jgi:hypothetical protein